MPTPTPSITSWSRLEPRSREGDMRTTLSARVFDPLWLLTRQWQVGEFQAEDAGTPVLARVRANTARSRATWGPSNALLRRPLRSATHALEVMVNDVTA